MRQRKITLAVLIILFVLPVTILAQRKRGMQFAIAGDIGFTGGAGGAMFRNQVLLNDNNIAFGKIAPDYSYGGLGSFSYMANRPAFVFFTIGGEIISNTAIQHINDIDAIGDRTNVYKKSINYKSTDILILGKVTCFFGSNAERPVYFEGGVKYSKLKAVKEDNSMDHPDYYLHTDGYDPAEKYNDNYRSLVMGVGHYGDFVSIGLRGSYALDDVTNGIDFMINDGAYDNAAINTNYATEYSEYRKTGLFTIELHITVTLSFIEIGKASCGSYYTRLFPLYKNCEYYW